ncbi:MAG: hypothetical protein A2176_13525 [Spirochaetes bacterium RBG_13_51_14]|nr:MAG: hypothetical protein A2176_13525 [Spirochaetes bacterium RBG_13_51_14]
MKMKGPVSAIATVLVAFSAISSFAISPAVKSTNDYAFTLETIRKIRIMVENFGDEELKKKYSDITTLFQEAGENYYGQDFTGSALKFKKLKVELISILETIDDLYLKRTKEILDSTSKETFSTLIEYSKQSGLAAFFKKPYDPMRDIKPYDTDKYHFFYDREKIVSYLREGYKNYERAKNIFNDPEIAVLKKKTSLTIKNMNYIINSYSEVVFLCREAKKNGIEIHKVKNINELGKSIMKYNITHGSVIPIYDDRIPEKYKVDANDNLRLIHAVEVKKLQKRG